MFFSNSSPISLSVLVSNRPPSKKSQPVWLRAAFIVMLTSLTYGLQELEQSSVSAVKMDLTEVNLAGIKEAELPQLLLSMSEAAFNREQ